MIKQRFLNFTRLQKKINVFCYIYLKFKLPNMKSILLFASMSILANFMWCGREADVQPLPPVGGTYNIINLDTWFYDTNNQIIGETKQTFNKGERTFELNNENGSYNEFENGVLTQSGTYVDNGNSIFVIIGNDTLRNEILGLGEASLRFQRFELLPSGKKQILIQSEK